MPKTKKSAKAKPTTQEQAYDESQRARARQQQASARRQRDAANSVRRDLLREEKHLTKDNLNAMLGIHPCTDSFLKQLSDPFNHSGAKNPAPNNVVPTVRSFTATTTANFEMGVGTNTSQMVFYPGHTFPEATDPLDSMAAHSRGQQVGPVTGTEKWVIGPLPGTTDPRATCILGKEAVTLNTVATDTSVAGFTAIPWDNAIGMTALEGASGHTRWTCTGFGVRIWNETPEAERAGSVTYAQPNFSFAPASGGTQKEYAKFPTYEVTTRANTDDGLEIVWIPKPQDLAFWHSHTTSYSNGISDAALVVFLNNRSTNAQNYRVEAVYHWQIAGESVNQLSSEDVLIPQAKNVLQPAVSIAAAHANSGSAIHSAARHVAATSAAVLPRIMGAVKNHGLGVVSRLLTAGMHSSIAPVARAGLKMLGPA